MSRANGKVNWPGWETVKVIGAGSFGTVYEIQRDVFGKTERAALKVISVPQDTNEVEELYNEGYDDASITAHLKECMEDIVKEYSLMLEIRGHSNIVYCEDLQYFPHEDGIGWDIFIKMELLTPLTKAFGNIYDEKQAIKLGIDMCRALKFCKQKNIIHRDIKPQNIFVSPSGDYKLGDFGIAKISDKTAGGTKVGTYEYMAPEIYNNQPYGTSSDLYSVGMVMYWAMNERRGPFLPLPPQIPTGSMKEEAYRRRFAGEALPKPAHGSERLWNIVSSACQFEPKNRYTSPDSLLSDLEALYNGTADHQNENSGTRQTHQSTAQQSQAYLEAYREKRITAATVAVFFDKEGIDLRGDHFAMTRIRNISRDARVFLDQNPEKLVNIKLSKITAKGTGPIDLNVNLSRETTGYDCRTGEEARIEQNLFDAVVADAKKYHQIDIMWSPLAVLRLWLIVGKGRKSLETENGVNISMPGLPTPQGPKDLKTVIAREAVYGGNTPPKPPGGKSFNEIFGDLFGKAGVKFSSGTTIEKELSVTLKESILGAKKDITVERNEHCGNCNGNGCAQCGGTGAVKKTQKIKINIPAGIATGQSVRFAGQGNCGKNGDSNGDLMIKITVLPDKTFTRKGADIHTTLSVPAAKAKRGGSVMVQTIYGWTNIKLPAKVETGRVFTIKGRGAPDIKDPNIKGDHIFTVVVE